MKESRFSEEDLINPKLIKGKIKPEDPEWVALRVECILDTLEDGWGIDDPELRAIYFYAEEFEIALETVSSCFIQHRGEWAKIDDSIKERWWSIWSPLLDEKEEDVVDNVPQWAWNILWDLGHQRD